tara:strand:+ start:4153 stop:4614 length:462 start_codon:yes stop_codon:yes gene_type:complete
MKLYIKTDSEGNPIDHPHMADNVHALYPDHDFDSGPPEGWAVFTRVEKPTLGPYEVFEDCGSENCEAFCHNGLTYELQEDGSYSDVWHICNITEEEKTEKQNTLKEKWAEHGFASWVFNEDTCSFDPPVPFPTDGTPYLWDEDTTSWVEVTDA